MGLPWTLSTGQLLPYENWAVAFEEITSAGILKLLRSPGIDSMESIPPAYVAWWAGTQPYSYSVRNPHRLFKTPGKLLICCKMYIADPVILNC
jgi:hypothetical protein